MKKQSILAALGMVMSMSLVAGNALAADPTVKIGTVDMQKALQSVESEKKTKSQL